MKKTNSKLMLISGLLLACNTFGQVVTVGDNLNWAPATIQTTQTSPSFTFCDGQTVNYTLSTPTGNFRHVSASGNPSLTNGVIFPANTSAGGPTVVINFSFTQDIENLRIRIHDLDGTTGPETVTGISPTYNSVTSTIGTLTTPILGASVGATVDNSSGWINWTGTILANTTISMTYNRPGAGYGLIIDSLDFSCSETPITSCTCNALVNANPFGQTNAAGFQNTTLSVNTLGQLISSLTIELPYYVSAVDDNCLKCDVATQELYGTITSAASIAGTPGVLFDPLGLGYSRKIVYTFPTPIAVNQSLLLNLRFPPVLELSCCKNRVKFCLDVTLKKPDCSTCVYTVCNGIPNAAPIANNKMEESSSSESNGVFIEDREIEETNEIKGLIISPNPASDFIEINVTDEDFLGREMVISSSLGDVITSIKLTNKNTRLNTENLTNGMYLLTITSQEKEETFKLIVQ